MGLHYLTLVLHAYLFCLNRWTKLDATTPDILANCDDLKVLGKGDFKKLLKWRTAIREEVGLVHNLMHVLAHT